MKENDLEERLRRDEEGIEVKPEAVEEKRNEGKVSRRAWKAVLSAAAALALVFGGAFLAVHIENRDSYSGEYEKLYGAIKEMSGQQKALIHIDTMDTARTESIGQSASSAGQESDKPFSQTNVQVEGVDEGDIIKTDGDYIYVLDPDYGAVTITKTKDGRMEKCSVIALDDAFNPQELYVTEDRLTVVGVKESEKSEKVRTVTCTYGTDDKENPKKQGTVVQSGDLSASRLRGGYLYIFSSYYPNIPSSGKNPAEYVPQVNDRLLRMPEITLPGEPKTPQYLVMTAIDLEKPQSAADRKAVLSSGEIFYVSKDYIYTASNSGYDEKDTEIRKFFYGDGQISYRATGKVKGYFNNSFSMDEYKGNLRLVTTLNTRNGGTYNHVYVLDENMKELGSILKLAKDERIYSARFLGDEGYFVTYRQVDPLFSVDFSDPASPKITGTLKIPGFSEYLHFYGKDRLLGIGQAVDENEKTSGIKLSMFDISDPGNVKEESAYVIKNTYEAEAIDDHRAVMIDPEKNLFGFAAGGDDGASYYIYRYKNGFRQVFSEPVGNSSYCIRGMYIGRAFYLMQGDLLRSYRLGDFKKISEIGL